MQPSTNSSGKPSQIEIMRKRLQIAELASEDERLTPETREKNRKAAETARIALRMMGADV